MEEQCQNDVEHFILFFLNTTMIIFGFTIFKKCEMPVKKI